jgi:sarcosine oxidase subunit beta
MRLAYTLWPTLHEQIDAATGFGRIGQLTLIERESELRAALARLWLQNRQGIPTRLVENAELHALEPHIGDTVIAALHCPRDGVADHTATTRALAAAAQRLGTVIREGSAVRLWRAPASGLSDTVSGSVQPKGFER